MRLRQIGLLTAALLMLGTGCSDPKPAASSEAETAKAREQVEEERRQFLANRVDQGRATTEPLQVAAARGDPAAQTELGGIIAYGELLPQDYIEAYKWLALAAAQGNETARFRRDAVASELSPEQLTEAERRVREWQPAL